MSARAAVRIETCAAFESVRALVGGGLRAIARPGASEDAPAALIAWCDSEADEGLESVERATACRKLRCQQIALVEAQVHCAPDALGLGGGIVNCKAWVPKEE